MKSVKQAVILAGGKGERMRPLTLTTPKPMIKIHNKPFLEYIVELLKENGIKDIVILTGYLHEKIENYFGDGEKFGVKIKYSFSPVDTNTGSRIVNALNLLDNNFLLLYGDNYWPLQLDQLFKFYKKMKTKGLVTVYSNIDNYTKNNTFVNYKGMVDIYDKSRQTQGLNGVDIGFFILDKNIFNNSENKNFSFEEIMIPRLIKEGQLSGFMTFHKYYSLSNLSRMPIIKKYFKEKKVVFLDRDGVINKKAPKGEYITDWKDFIFLPKVKQALKLLNKKRYMIFIITNQPGIAREIVSRERVDKINNKMLFELKKEGIKITDLFLCPHGWNEGCFCRKPSPGMFFQASWKYYINLLNAYCIGDDERDIIAGTAAGCKSFLVDKNNNLYSIVEKNL